MKATKSVYIANSLIGANGMHGIRVEKGETNEKRELNLFGVNITGHFLNPAVQLDECSWMEIYLNHCHIYDNHDGALIVDGRSDTCEINVFNGNFTRNRGPTLHMSSLNRGTVHLESNSFTNNHMNARADREALINLELGTGAGIVVTDNQFVKNTMESVVKLAQRDRTPPTVVIAKNTFYNNLAFNVIYADVQNANISYNLLYNQQPLLRVCAIDAGASEAALYLPFANYSGPLFIGETQPTPPFTHLYNTFVNNGRPYLITQDLVIPEGKVVIIEPGTTLKFSSGAKMVVKGKLYANGSLSRPIRLLANDETNPWGGVVLSENSTATLSDVLISNAIDGIHVETPNMQMERITIENTRKNGIVIGESGGSDLDFGHSTIRRVSQNAVLVEERNESLAIRNLRIEDSSATGFTYEKPKKNLTLENVQLSNLSPPENGYSIKLFDDPAKKLERFELRNVSVMNQKFGSGGIFYEGSAGVVDVFGGNFQANSVPALGFKFKCHEIPSNLHVIGANFVENTDAPLRIELGECASAQGNPISEILLYANKFNGNTASKSTLSLENQSGKRIVSNELRDPKTPREVLYSGEKKLDLTNNFWGTQLVQEIKPKIGCIGKCQDLSKVDIIPPRGSLIDITPIDISTIGRESSACAGGCGGHGTCTLSGCLCNGGYSGKDCQEILPPVCMIACAHGRQGIALATRVGTGSAAGRRFARRVARLTGFAQVPSNVNVLSIIGAQLAMNAQRRTVSAVIRRVNTGNAIQLQKLASVTMDGKGSAVVIARQICANRSHQLPIFFHKRSMLRKRI
ncbi:unnamed protein product, partial [Mesorhabditis belari]|uniref:EGF-like domain-containing protein n=1 Tax=Mesorhabditis belari TaxID=2138241 RepID=A0AAF3F0P9_9BILA